VAAAQARTANAELLRRQGDIALIQKIDGNVMTLAKWCEEYERRYVKRADAKPLTLISMRAQLKPLRDATFAKQGIDTIKTSDISELIEEVEERGATMAKKVLSRAIYVFRAAEAKGLIPVGSNPATPIEKPRVVVARSRLTLDEFNAILAEVRKGGNPWMEHAMLLALLSAQRREDIVKMQFSQVKDGFLWIEQSKGRKGRETKLRIPVAIKLKAVSMTLNDVLKQCCDAVLSKYVIHHKKDLGFAKAGAPVEMGTVSNTFATYRDRANLKITAGRTPPTFHEIRSLAARLYAEEYGAETGNLGSQDRPHDGVVP
jgi:integrase